MAVLIHCHAATTGKRVSIAKGLKMSCSLIGKTPFFGSGLYQFKSGQLSYMFFILHIEYNLYTFNYK